ncbi:MAG: DUF2726 domain-containing protein [Lachnospiraceae bacterium]|jgi:hypothetical protein|nr:DUF2726 domain-containing protein [Lachnospiraceae bacterium]
MFGFLRNWKSTRESVDMGNLLQEMKHLNQNITCLINQNAQLLDRRNDVQYSGQKKRETVNQGGFRQSVQEEKKYTSYAKGQMSKPKSFFDSPAEKVLEGYLDNIFNKYKLGLNFSIRIVPHQPLSNYVQKTHIEQVNLRNTFMHIDFLIEVRKWKKGKDLDDMSGHFPILAIELNGRTHEKEEQRERDEYKRGVCARLNIPFVAIEYQEGHFTQKDIEAAYLQKIMTDIFMSIFNLSLMNEDIKQYSKLLGREKRDILQKYPIDKFPEIHRYVQDAYDSVYNAYAIYTKS